MQVDIYVNWRRLIMFDEMKRATVAVAVFFISSVLFMGCNSSQTESVDSNSAPNSAPTQAASTSATAETASTPPPAALANSSELAENVYDAVWQKDWKTADAKFQQLQSNGSQMQQSSDAQMETGQLEKALKARDRMGALRASNELTNLFTSAMRPYQNKVPVDVMKLDYLGRRLQVDAGAKDMTSAKMTVQDLRHTWDNVRPEIIRNNGAAEASNFEALVTKMEKANSAQALSADAASELAQVDKLEGVFK
ncbi:MAG: hypothetical protein ABI383_01020 [Acidobacteriaceae bacterium]